MKNNQQQFWAYNDYDEMLFDLVDTYDDYSDVPKKDKIILVCLRVKKHPEYAHNLFEDDPDKIPLSMCDYFLKERNGGTNCFNSFLLSARELVSNAFEYEIETDFENLQQNIMLDIMLENPNWYKSCLFKNDDGGLI